VLEEVVHHDFDMMLLLADEFKGRHVTLACILILNLPMVKF